MAYHVSLNVSVMERLIDTMSADSASSVELVLYEYLRCGLVEYGEFLLLMERYRLCLHSLDMEVS